MTFVSPRLRPFVLLCASIVLTVFLLIGCARTGGPSHLSFDAAQYHEAFDAAVDVARHYTFTATLRDRRGGVIETEPTHAGTIMEPWMRSTLSVDRALESTFNHQRRRARFEFIPLEFVPEDEDQRIDTTGISDMTDYDGEMELRVWVYVERSHTPGVRRSTLSRRLTTRATIIEPETGEPLPRLWTPTARDPVLERHLLAKIEDALTDQELRSADAKKARLPDESP